MPEDRMSTTSTNPTESAATAERLPDPAFRAGVFRRFLVAFGAVALTSVGCYLLVYFQTDAWQMLVSGGALLAGLLVGLLAFRVARRGNVEAGGYIFLTGLAVVYAVTELVWAQATPYLLATGAVLMLVGGSLLLPQRWLSWLILLGYLGLCFVVINQLEPLPRYDIQASPVLQYYVPVLNVFLMAALIWQAVAALRRVRTIRARLLTISIGTVLLTAAAIGATTTLIGYQDGRQQAIDRLELVSSLRETEIDNWVTDIRDTLAASLQQAPEHRFVEADVAAVVSGLIDSPADSEDYRDAYGFLSYNFQQWLKQAQGYDLVFFMDRDGTVLISTDPEMEGTNLGEQVYFNRGTVGSYMTPPQYDEASGQVQLFTSRPILGEYARLLGVLAGRVDASNLDKVMRMRERASLGESGETYLVGRDFRMLTNSRFGTAGTEVRTEAVDIAIQPEEEGPRSYTDYQGEVEGTGTYINYQGEPVIGVYRWLPDLQVALVAEQSRAEAFQAVNRSVILNALIALVAVLVAGGISLYVARDIGDPLSNLAQAASGIAAGDLQRSVRIDRRDEIGTLANAFSSMTERLRSLIGRLEERVAERTEELEIRSNYLEASADVARVASTILDADQLTQAVVELVQDRFDLYYVGLFLLNPTGEWAQLHAGTGAAGREMLMEGHRLRVGGNSMIGQCVSRRAARIALDVGEEAVRFENPLLPRTRSEAALPLQSRGRVYGAITVQSAEPAAFDETTVTVLQTMADQVAVALDNAYLFAEAQESLQAARRASAAMSREGWAHLLQSQPALGYHSDERGVTTAATEWRPEMEAAVRAGRTVLADDTDGGDSPEDRSDLQSIAVPIRVAGKVVAVLNTHKRRTRGPWSEDEIETLESLAEQMAVSLESARLYQETQTRAAREQLVTEITSRLRSSLDPDTILRTTVRELGSALDTELASVVIAGPPRDGDGGRMLDRDRFAGEEED